MPQTAMMVPHVTGIPGLAQAGFCLERAVSRRLIQAKRLPIAIWLPLVGTQGGGVA